DARELPAGCDLSERRERLARVRRDAKLHRLEPSGTRQLEGLEGDLEPAAGHRETLQGARDLRTEALRGVPARLRKLHRELAIGLLRRPLLLAQLLEALLAAQLRQARAALGKRGRKLRRLHAVFARGIHHGANARVELGEARRVEVEALQVTPQLLRALRRVHRRAFRAAPRILERRIEARRLREARCDGGEPRGDRAIGLVEPVGARARLEGERLELADLVREELALARGDGLGPLARRALLGDLSPRAMALR